MDNQIANYKYIHKKVNMADAIPLDTPFTVVIEPTNACNFKCSFCFHSLKSEELKKQGFSQNNLSADQYKKIIEDIMSFPEQIKVLRFSGFGEPLLNKKLGWMVEYAKKLNVAERIMVISNGSLLTNEASDSLIKAGLDELLISVEGLSDEKYKELCSVDINFENFVNNMSYFYKNKNECKIFARVLNDDMSEADCRHFHNTFKSITDAVFMDNIIPLFDGVNYSGIVSDDLKDIEGNPKKSLEVCIQPFNSLFIHASGNVSACCTDYLEKIVFGNVFNESLIDIWNGRKLNKFRIMHLKKMRKNHLACKKCDYMNYVNQEENILDDRSEEILDRMVNIPSVIYGH